MFTDGAATVANTAAPVFTSASYNFLAGDVGAWVFIASGTDWTPGWYKIASVASNAATLSAAIGAAVGSTGATTSPIIPSTIIGCATVASPTGATWSIDYSQQAAAQFAYTDLASAGAGLTVSSAAKPFAKQQVGNSLVITGGTNFTAGRYVIASVAAGVATVVGPGNITTGVGASGTGGQGGALLSPALPGAHMVASNQLFIKTATYTVTSASTNIAAGCFSSSVGTINIEGYATVRGALLPIGAAGTRPTIIASGISTFTLIATSGGQATTCRNFILDGASLTASKGFSGNGTLLSNVLGQNFTAGLVTGNGSANRCEAIGCATVSPFSNTGGVRFCVAYGNTVTPFLNNGPTERCVSYANTGGSTSGFSSNVANAAFTNNVAYGNGLDGFVSTGIHQHWTNNIGEGNTGVPFTLSGAGLMAINNASYLNTGGAAAITSVHVVNLGFITGSASFFTNPGSGDFSLNNTAGGGALLRAAGYPGVFKGGLTTGYLDVGAAQHADPAGGGGGGAYQIQIGLGGL